MTDPKLLGRTLKRAREDAGLTQAEVVERLGMKRAVTLSDHERGEYAPRGWQQLGEAELRGLVEGAVGEG